MNCKEKLKILMEACEKELATSGPYDKYSGNRNDWLKNADGWRASDYGTFFDESDSWKAIKEAFMKVEGDEK